MTSGHKDYSGTPLPKKLGIKEHAGVLVVSPPKGFHETLGRLPGGSEIVDRDVPAVDVVILFATRAEDLGQFEMLSAKLSPAGGLWVAWPKKSSAIPSDLDFQSVQQVGLTAGLVDNKSCSIDEQWQGLRFVVRLEDRKGV
jgi:hypothetical protein